MFTKSRAAALLIAAALYPASAAFAQNGDSGQGRAIVTVLGKNTEATPAVTQQDVKVQVAGKFATVTGWAPLTGQQSKLELVLLIDDSARTSLSRQFDELGQFLKSLPPDTAAGVAYMINGRAAFSGPLTTDHAQLIKEIHITAGAPGENASPYFCLSDLAKRWPSNDRTARREVLMLTDGVDNYERRFDPDDPYVQAAITDSIRSGLVVYSIYWRDSGRFDRTNYGNDTGQNLLSLVTAATGGNDYWEGTGNPVSFQPFLEDLSRRLQNQYELGVTAKIGQKPQVETMKLKISAPAIKVTAPQQVFIAPGGGAQQ